MYKVLYICPSTGTGGAETFIKQTFSKANKDEFENHYLLFRAGPLYDFLNSEGANTHLLKSPPRMSKWGDHQAVNHEVKKIINDCNIDIVHSTMAYGAIFSAWTCKQMKVPHVWFQHGPASGWTARVASILPHNGMIVNSHFTGKKQRELENPLRFLIPRENPIEKILPGTDIKKPSDDKIEACKKNLFTQHNLEANCVIISMLCRVQEWKGIHILLDALKLLRAEDLAQNYFCCIWGEAFKDSDYFARLEQTIHSENLPAKMMGAAEDVPLCLAATDIIVNASTQPEPFGLPIIEGMMVGAIPVVPNEGGPIEIVRNGKDGLVFKARQTLSLSQKLKTLLLDKELRRKLSHQAIETAQQKYNAERAIKHLEQFYKKVIR